MPNMLKEFVEILEFINLNENNHISGSKDEGILEFVQKSFDELDQEMTMRLNGGLKENYF